MDLVIFTLFSYQCILSHSNQRNFHILNENNLSKYYQNLTPQEINIRPLVKFSHYSVDKMVRNKLNLVLLIHREAGFGIIHFQDITLLSKVTTNDAPRPICFTSKQKHTEVIKSSERLTIGALRGGCVISRHHTGR